MNEEIKEMNMSEVTIENETSENAVSENELLEALLRAGAATKRESRNDHRGHYGHHSHHMHGHHKPGCGRRGYGCGPRTMHAPVYGVYPYAPVMYGPAFRRPDMMAYRGPVYGMPVGQPGFRGYGAPVGQPGFRGYGAPVGQPGFRGYGAPVGRKPEGFGCKPEFAKPGCGAPVGRKPEGCKGEGKKPEHKGYGRILAKLNPGEAISQKELAERLGIRPQSVSEALYVLAERGLIERSVCESDRRVMLISLSEEGAAIREKMMAHRANRANRFFACLTEDEKAELLRLLNKIAEAQKAEAAND